MKIIPETFEKLRQFGLTTIAAGRCTGWRAMAALVAAFGDKVVTPTAVGKRFVYRRHRASQPALDCSRTRLMMPEKSMVLCPARANSS